MTYQEAIEKLAEWHFYKYDCCGDWNIQTNEEKQRHRNMIEIMFKDNPFLAIVDRDAKAPKPDTQKGCDIECHQAEQLSLFMQGYVREVRE